jgi:hypothetical protein
MNASIVLCSSLFGLFCSLWHFLHTGVFVPAVFVFSFAAVVLCCINGRTFVHWSNSAALVGDDVFVFFVIGLFLTNLLLLCVQVCSPFAVGANAVIVAFLILAASRAKKARQSSSGLPSVHEPGSVVLLVLILFAVTFW